MSDKDKEISSIQYNSLNLPTYMKIGKKGSARYLYDSKGNKIEEQRKVANMGILSHQTRYCDNFIFEDGVLKRILVEGGFIYFGENDTTYHYFLKDHLGSNRAVVNMKTGEVAEQYDYYPFGKQHGDYHTGYIHPYRYNGKELDEIGGLDWLHYGARMMEPAWGRFTTPDPMAEKYYDVSPYVYCANNPSNMVDYDGCDYWSTNDQEQIKAFINAMGSGQTQFDFSGWNHATDAEICGNLTYNDETHKFYTSYTSVVDGELTVIGKSFDANITPVSYSGLGYEGAYVYQPTTSSWKKIILSLDGGLKYNDGQNNWNVNLSGRITGLAPIEGVVDINTPAQRSKAIMTLLSKGAKVCKSFGTKHGEKIFQLGNRYYSFDNTQHNGGVYKVFEREGGNLKRIGTADKDLRIFKK